MPRYARLHRLPALLTVLVLGLSWYAVARAQSVAPPPACAGKTGEELRDCVRNATPADAAQRVEPFSSGSPYAQTVNCARVYPADRPFCLHRNQVIIECRHRARHPDFQACFQHYIANAPVPGDERCTGKKAQRSACEQRNAAHAQCRAYPLRYFSCLGQDPPR